jgi:hypothetical protein
MTDNTDDSKKMKVEFAPGCFDNFDGTQEELDQLIADLTVMAESGALLENSEPLNLEELFEEDPETALRLAHELGLFEGLEDEEGEAITFETIRDLMLEERKKTLN